MRYCHIFTTGKLVCQTKKVNTNPLIHYTMRVLIYVLVGSVIMAISQFISDTWLCGYVMGMVSVLSFFAVDKVFFNPENKNK